MKEPENALALAMRRLDSVSEDLAVARRLLSAAARAGNGSAVGELELLGDKARRAAEFSGKLCGVEQFRFFLPDRSQEVVRARNLAWWLLRRTGLSYSQIGRAFKMHHTSVLHGVRELERQMKRGLSFTEDYRRLDEEFSAGAGK